MLYLKPLGWMAMTETGCGSSPSAVVHLALQQGWTGISLMWWFLLRNTLNSLVIFTLAAEETEMGFLSQLCLVHLGNNIPHVHVIVEVLVWSDASLCKGVMKPEGLFPTIWCRVEFFYNVFFTFWGHVRQWGPVSSNLWSRGRGQFLVCVKCYPQKLETELKIFIRNWFGASLVR